MCDYYTLMELMVVLKKENARIMKQLDVLNVFLKFHDMKNSLDYSLDYDVLENEVVIKHVLNNSEYLSFFNKLSLITKKGENKILEENNNYFLEKENVAVVNPTYQQHFNLGIRNILYDLFLNNFYLNYDFEFENKKYYLTISPANLVLRRFDEQNKVDYEFYFSPKNCTLDFSKSEYIKEIDEIVNIKIPKKVFSSEIIELIDNILNICSKSEFSENNLVSQDDLYGNSTLILKDNIQTNFSKRRN